MGVFNWADVQLGLIKRWDYKWFLEAGIWEAMFLVVLSAMMVLWAPREEGSHLAYSEQIATYDPEGQDASMKHARDDSVWTDEDPRVYDDDLDTFGAVGEALSSSKSAKGKTNKVASSDSKPALQPDLIGAALD